mgnify:CR=1 FL=1
MTMKLRRILALALLLGLTVSLSALGTAAAKDETGRQGQTRRAGGCRIPADRQRDTTRCRAARGGRPSPAPPALTCCRTTGQSGRWACLRTDRWSSGYARPSSAGTRCPPGRRRRRPTCRAGRGCALRSRRGRNRQKPARQTILRPPRRAASVSVVYSCCQHFVCKGTHFFQKTCHIMKSFL